MEQGPPTGRARWSAALRLDRSLGWREFALALVALALVAVVALGPHVRDGGFWLDDWSNAVASLQPPGGPNIWHAISLYSEITLYRPVLVLYVPLTYFVFGMNSSLHLAWSAVLAVLAAAALYGVLRRCAVPWIHAWIIAALTVVYPWSDSTRMWPTGGLCTLSIFFLLAGLFVALSGLRRGNLRWHLGAAVLYLLSILTYELTLPVIACLGFLYWLLRDWKTAKARWIFDLGAVLIGGVWVGTQTPRTSSGLSGDFHHLRMIISAGETILGLSGVPFGPSEKALVIVALALVLIAGAATYLGLRRRGVASPGWGLGSWLVLSASGIALAALGWVMLIPADPYYTPSVYGTANRINAVAAFGLVLAVYGAFGVLGSLIGRVQPRRQIVIGTCVTVVLGVVLAGTYTHVLRRHTELWGKAYTAEEVAMQRLNTVYPTLKEGTTIFASDYPANQTPGITILAADWDLSGMVQMGYENENLTAYPVLAELHLKCGPRGVSLVGPVAPTPTARYGTVKFVDLSTMKHVDVNTRGHCLEVAPEYEFRGPSTRVSNTE